MQKENEQEKVDDESEKSNERVNNRLDYSGEHSTVQLAGKENNLRSGDEDGCRSLSGYFVNNFGLG